MGLISSEMYLGTTNKQKRILPQRKREEGFPSREPIEPESEIPIQLRGSDIFVAWGFNLRKKVTILFSVLAEISSTGRMQVRQNGKTSIFYRKEKEKKVSRHERQITAVRNFYLILFQGRKKKS